MRAWNLPSSSLFYEFGAGWPVCDGFAAADDDICNLILYQSSKLERSASCGRA